jgi:hypothetical protein
MKHDKVFQAVAKAGDTPEELAEKLSCEATRGLPFEARLHTEITKFRKLRQDARVSAARSYLTRNTVYVHG